MGRSSSSNVFCYQKTLFSVREDCLRKWNSINNLGPSQKMDNMFTTHAVTDLKLSSISRL